MKQLTCNTYLKQTVRVAARISSRPSDNVSGNIDNRIPPPPKKKIIWHKIMIFFRFGTEFLPHPLLTLMFSCIVISCIYPYIHISIRTLSTVTTTIFVIFLIVLSSIGY